MFEFARDRAAAEKALYAIFEGEDTRTRKEREQVFLMFFRKSYQSTKRRLELECLRMAKDVKNGEIYSYNIQVFNQLVLPNIFNKAYSNLMFVFARNRWNANKNHRIDEVKWLGAIFGMILAGIEYGIVSEYFKVEEENNDISEKQFAKKYSDEVLDIFKNIGKELKMLDKSIDSKFIANRIEKIKKKGATKLSENKIRFIEEIAAAFY